MAVISTSAHPLVACRETAAAVWGLASLGLPPERVHLLDTRASTTQTTRHAVKHRGALEESEVHESCGILVTSPARTALDLAAHSARRPAVVALDDGYRQGLFTAAELLEGLGRRGEHRGAVRAEAAIRFADGRADSPGESLSRLVFDEAGLEPPTLQQPFQTRRGRFLVDFWWERAGVVGEFDGEVKYRDRSMRQGRSAEDVVVDEKRREDAIREDPRVRRFVRWTWADVWRPGLVPALLREAGVAVLGSTASRMT